MKRWRDRLVSDRADPERLTDTFFAFAQACYHLVDWLENDSSQPIRRRQADQHVAQLPALAFCRNVCDGSKHAQLESKKAGVRGVLAPTNVELEFVPPNQLRAKIQHAPELYMRWEGKPITALEFADRCIEDWERLLHSAGLLDKGPAGAGPLDQPGEPR
jgi:hypothetical protein